MLLKRGQVTVFIIVGILLLAIVGFMFFIVSEMQLGELQAEQEQIIGKTFQKEALRIFVEDCLTDSLEEGLIVIGEQGRLWSDNPGGTLHFQEGINGRTFLSNYSLYYAITYQEELEHPNSYPCEDQINESPTFCKYEFPDSATFGDKGVMTKTAIQEDLKRYIINQSSECVSEFLLSNLSISSQIQEEEIDISSLLIEPDGISVEVQYPLELIVDDEVYFHLVDFSFFYPSPKLEDLLAKAVNDPLNKEIGNVTFHFNQTELDASGSVYRDLDTEIQKFEANSEGDTIIRYNLSAGKVLKTQPYLFQFAIENRPPALDYASKFACSNYDYLVLSGAQDEMGEINITPNALDPDDDEVSYDFFPESFTGFDPEWSIDGNRIEAEVPAGVTSGIYNLTINSTDEHGSDWQIVRILVDPRVEVDMWIATPYNNFTGSSATISIEDPVFLYINITSTGDIQGEVLLNTLNYDSGVAENFTVSTALTGGLNCIPLPYDYEEDPPRTCDTASFEDDIETWTNFYLNEINESPYFSEETTIGELDYELNIDYCGAYSQTPDDHIDLTVRECIPFENPEYPYASNPTYLYHEMQFGLDPNEDTNYSDFIGFNGGFSSFMSSHTCCDVDYTVKEYGEECYWSPPGCYGGLIGWTNQPGYDSYIMEQIIDYCSGERGNTCGWDQARNFTLFNEELNCGYRDMEGCQHVLIAEECQGEEAWGFIDIEGNDAWCHGQMGCTQICYQNCNYYEAVNGGPAAGHCGAVVYLGGGQPPSDINQKAKDSQALDDGDAIYDPNFNFECTCSGNDGMPCDSDYDGSFDGTCSDDGNIWECIGD